MPRLLNHRRTENLPTLAGVIVDWLATGIPKKNKETPQREFIRSHDDELFDRLCDLQVHLSN